MERSPWWNRLAALAVSLTLITPLYLLVSCNDDSASMAQQISGGAGSKPAASSGDAASAGGQKAPGGARPGLPGKGAKPGEEAPAEGAEGAEAPAEGEVPQPKLTLTVLDIHAPAPMFEKAGRYDLKVEVTLEEYVDAKVWKVVALDAEGKEVGSDLQFLYFPLNQPQSLAFNDMYCMSKPVDVKLIYTGKDAKKPGEGEGEADKGSVSGQGVSGGRAAGGTKGGGGKAPSAPGGDKEGEGEGDAGGGDEGGDEGEE